MNILEELESEVRVYCRNFPKIFARASNCHLYTETGEEYLDFLAGAGSLNYGHNNPVFKAALIEYINDNGISQSLDLWTSAKCAFVTSFHERILKPRAFNYKLQFTGPTGTNCVEAALKLARKVTGRTQVLSFTNGFHGVSLGAVAVTGNRNHRRAAGIALPGASAMPYDGYLGTEFDTLDLLEKLLADGSSGVDLPAAIIVETIQGEGGLNTASADWLQHLSRLCKSHEILLIVDDIQAGNGRSGDFFSFEFAGIVPDMVVMSKSIGGYGLPMSVLLLRPELDIWAPGEHNGTFRGNNLAFVAAAAALETYWKNMSFSEDVKCKAIVLRRHLDALCRMHKNLELKVKGRGFMQGIELPDRHLARRTVEEAFKRNLIIETCGPQNNIVKCLMPLTISEKNLVQGVFIISEALDAAVSFGLSRAS